MILYVSKSPTCIIYNLRPIYICFDITVILPHTQNIYFDKQKTVCIKKILNTSPVCFSASQQDGNDECFLNLWSHDKTCTVAYIQGQLTHWLIPLHSPLHQDIEYISLKKDIELYRFCSDGSEVTG